MLSCRGKEAWSRTMDDTLCIEKLLNLLVFASGNCLSADAFFSPNSPIRAIRWNEKSKWPAQKLNGQTQMVDVFQLAKIWALLVPCSGESRLMCMYAFAKWTSRHKVELQRMYVVDPSFFSLLGCKFQKSGQHIRKFSLGLETSLSQKFFPK